VSRRWREVMPRSVDEMKWNTLQDSAGNMAKQHFYSILTVSGTGAFINLGQGRNRSSHPDPHLWIDATAKRTLTTTTILTLCIQPSMSPSYRAADQT
jgi:hypothetical protein